jgi:transcriptional regulator with XRE-family HTH domain
MEKEIFTKRLGENIAQVRMEKKMTQVQLAHLCKKQKQNINRLEAGQMNPTIYFLFEIAQALKVPISRLTDFHSII